MSDKPRGYWGIVWRKKAPEARALSAAKSRCNNPSNPQYPAYGGRGIKVCAEWSGRDGLERFIEHIGPRPSPEHSIDRINNDGNYEPGNVRWATQIEQTNNTRRNVFIEWRGERRTAAQWSRIVGVPGRIIAMRIARGWSSYRALTTRSCTRGVPDTSPITASDGQAPEAVVPKNPAENAES